MTVYAISSLPASVIWPEPTESIWQVLPTYSQIAPNWKRLDLGLCDRLFIGAVINSPKEQRAWGSINWLSDVFQVSRPTLYTIGERTKSSLLTAPSQPSVEVPATEVSEGRKIIAITPNRMKRTTLSLVLPGGVSERSIRDCLRAAFDEERCAAFVSALIHEAGQRAGEILAKVNHAVMGAVMQARDELFVGRDPILLMVDPHSLVITGLYATEDRDAETWGCVLLFTQDRRVQIKGLSEDGCIPYEKSCKLAKLYAAIQKDVWHPLEEVRKVIHDIEREAYKKLETTEKLEKQLLKRWDDAVFVQWVGAYEQLEALLTQIDQLSFWRGCLWDAVELVDWRNGEIRHRAINQWLADETLKGIQQLSHPRIQKYN